MISEAPECASVIEMALRSSAHPSCDFGLIFPHTEKLECFVAEQGNVYYVYESGQC